MAKLVSKVYGDALLGAAREKDCLDGLYEEVQMLTSVLEKNKDLIQLLNHPQVVKEEKLRIIETIFHGRVSDVMMGFLAAVVEKGRQNDIFDIFRYFTAQVKEQKKIGTAYVTTAVELSDARKKQVEEKLLATTSYVRFEMNYATDPSLIGGMVIRIGDRVADSSVRTRLQDLKRRLMDANISL